jgi:hypothetical protein
VFQDACGGKKEPQEKTGVVPDPRVSRGETGARDQNDRKDAAKDLCRLIRQAKLLGNIIEEIVNEVWDGKEGQQRSGKHDEVASSMPCLHADLLLP